MYARKNLLKSSINHSLIKNKIYIIIEGTDTPAGKLFDVLILVAIITSVLVVMLDSVLFLRLQYGRLFFVAEWFFTILFTIEYALRLYSAPNLRRYVTSFYGAVGFIGTIANIFELIFCRYALFAGCSNS